MAIVVDNHTDGSAAATSVTVSHQVKAGPSRILIVQAFANFDIGGGGGIIGATYGGVAMTQIGTFDSNNIVAWYLLDPPPGTQNVVVTQNVSRALIVAVTSLFGVSQSKPITGVTSGYNSTGITVPSLAGCMVFAQSGDNAGRLTWTATGGQTASGYITQGTTTAAWGRAPGAATVAMNWSGTGGANLPRNLGFSVVPDTGSWTTSKGFNFRNTSGYVTDDGNQVGVITTTTYPTVGSIGGQIVTYGWESVSTDMGRDRIATAPYVPRLSGLAQIGNGDALTEAVFRVDLPSTGLYAITIGAGDYSFGNRAYFQIRDTSSALFSVGDTAVAQQYYADACGTVHTSAANWVANNVPRTANFSTTIFRFANLRPSTTSSVIAHISIMPAAARFYANGVFQTNKVIEGYLI